MYGVVKCCRSRYVSVVVETEEYATVSMLGAGCEFVVCIHANASSDAEGLL